MAGYGVGHRASIHDKGGIFLIAVCTQPALGPTQPPVQSVLGVLSPGVKCGRNLMLTTHPLLLPRLNPLSPQAPFMACSESTLLRCVCDL
jgi:hypothetical protein